MPSPRRIWLYVLREDRREHADSLRDCWAMGYFTDAQWREEVARFRENWRYAFREARRAYVDDPSRWMYEAYA